MLTDVAQAVADVSDLDLTVEWITHRFTSASKEVRSQLPICILYLGTGLASELDTERSEARLW
jgi:hypothetical protein